MAQQTGHPMGPAGLVRSQRYPRRVTPSVAGARRRDDSVLCSGSLGGCSSLLHVEQAVGRRSTRV